MIGYKRTLQLCMISFFLLLLSHVIYSIVAGTSEQMQKTLIWSVCVFSCVLFFVQIFKRQEIVAVCVIICSSLISTYYIGVVLHTLSFAIIIFIAAALILALFLEKRYIIIWGISSVLVEISFMIFFPDIILEMIPSLFLYSFYILSYLLCLIPLYVLVDNASRNYILLHNKAKEHEEENNHKVIFMAGISNELRTPIHVIQGMSQMLLKEKLTERQHEYAKIIQEAGQSLQELIQYIISLTQLESGLLKIQAETYDFYNTIHEIINHASSKMDIEHIRVISCIAPQIPRALIGDCSLLRQILYYLIVNDAEYLRTGEVHMDIDMEPSPADLQYIQLRIQISCNGKEISTEELAHYQELFHKNRMEKMHLVEKNKFERALVLCNELTELMGGTLLLDNKSGKGVTVTLCLPQRIGEEEELTVSSAEVPEVFWMTEKRNVLVVDDTISNLKTMRGILEIHGIHVDLAESGPEALMKMQEKHYDLIFMDYLMPQMNGVETFLEIKKSDNPYFQGIPIIVLTTNRNLIDAEEYRKIGFSDCLQKPVEQKNLEALLLKYLKES